MKRNEFFKKVGALAGLALVAPKVLAGNKEEVTGEIKKLYYSRAKPTRIFIDKGQENPEWIKIFTETTDGIFIKIDDFNLYP